MKKSVLAGIVLYASLGFSHGSDKPGPNGGYIQMPGAFHTEVVADSDGSYHIYLLDMEFKNQSVKDSDVKAWLKSGKKKIELNCKVMEQSHFHCMSSEKGFNSKELVVKAKRENMQGNDAIYKLPLRR